MCGIAGFVGWESPPDTSVEQLSAMCDAIRHRGPDDEGHFVTDGVGLGMRRLSIIDLDGGRQPIGNEDGKIQVVFNGEIYNYRELRSELIGRGHVFTTHSDTETLVHLYEDHGEGLVHHLNGMFGFAIWDGNEQSLLLARDRLGIKPVYYWEHAGGVAFASELRSLFRLPQFPQQLDHEAIAYFMALGYVPDPLTAFCGVRKLPPGHFLRWDSRSGVRVDQYWKPESTGEIPVSVGEAVEQIRWLLSDSVRMRLIADVPLGAFLSSGTDSSAVVAAMVNLSSTPVRTFSIGFEEAEFNEANEAAQLAEQLGTVHTELIVRPDVDGMIEDLVECFGEPFADSSAIPTFLVSRLASEHVKVALSGDGGDELFGGYTRYMQIGRRNEVRPPFVRDAVGALGRVLPQGFLGRGRMLDLSRTKRGRYASTVAHPLPKQEGGVANDQLSGLIPPFDRLLDPWFDRVRDRDFQSQVALVDLMTYLPGDILTKVDRMSMACSLEARVPLLDYRMVEFATSLPTEMKMRSGGGKWVFRQAIADSLPQSVLNRPKRGFAMPLNGWFRKELKHRTDQLLVRNSPVFDHLDFPAVGRVVEEHYTDRRDHSTLLWRILVLQLWLNSLDRRAGIR